MVFPVRQAQRIGFVLMYGVGSDSRGRLGT